MGDARLTLDREPDSQFDLLIIDAFSSDAIPVHLLTREAVEMYLKKLAPGGLLMVHLSNRHLLLAPVVAGTAEVLGVVARVRNDYDEESETNKTSSTWAVLAKRPEDLGAAQGQRRLGAAQAQARPAALDRRLLEHRQRDELGLGLAAQVDATDETRGLSHRHRHAPRRTFPTGVAPDRRNLFSVQVDSSAGANAFCNRGAIGSATGFRAGTRRRLPCEALLGCSI